MASVWMEELIMMMMMMILYSSTYFFARMALCRSSERVYGLQLHVCIYYNQYFARSL